MDSQWLKCRVLKGMFSDERAIVFTMSNGGKYSEFVPSSAVRGEIDQDGLVRVNVFKDGKTLWAVLPTEYSDSVPVKSSQLVAG
jgi:hypothetical protein